MRKWFWYAAAAMFVGAGGVGLYAYRQPNSVVGQMVIQASEFGFQVNPVTRITRQVLACADRTETLCGQAGKAAACPKAQPVEEPAGKPLPGAVDLSRLWQLPVEGSEDDKVRAILGLLEPPATARHGRPQPEMPNADNEQPIKQTQFTQPEGEGAATEPSRCQQVMPYCPEQQDSKTMPPALEGSADPYDPAPLNKPGDKPSDPLSAEHLGRIIGAVLSDPVGSKPLTGSTEESEPAGSQPATPESSQPSDGSTPGCPSMMPGCPHGSSDPYHSRYIVCPYSGKCVEAAPSCDSQKECKSSKEECQPNNQTSTTREEYERIAAPTELIEPAPKVKKSKKKTTRIQSRYTPSLPVAPFTDTMEYRRSDGTLNEIGPGPF